MKSRNIRPTKAEICAIKKRREKCGPNNGTYVHARQNVMTCLTSVEIEEIIYT